jgi:hypothetical protein
MSTEKFWVVWQPESGAPTYRHGTYESAQKEAERLAECAPKHAFFVLEAVSVSRKVSVITTPLTRTEDDLPF